MKPKKLMLLASMVIFASLLILIPTATGENPKVGDGVLYVYKDEERTIEADWDSANYLVWPGERYYLNITGIDTTKEVTSPDIWIWYTYKPDGKAIKDVIYSGPWDPATTNVAFNWTVPFDIPIDTYVEILYDDVNEGPSYKARDRGLTTMPATLLVIDEVFLGSFGAIIALSSGFGVKAFLRKRKKANP